jgi:hypothetical protein
VNVAADVISGQGVDAKQMQRARGGGATKAAFSATGGGEEKGSLTQRRKDAKKTAKTLKASSPCALSLRLCASSVKFLPDEDGPQIQTEQLRGEELL